MKGASHQWQDRRGGFSVIELMTVLVVVAVSISLVAPSLGSYVDRIRTRRALDRIVADVAYARLYSVQEGRRTAVRLQSNGTYTIDTLSAGGSWAAMRTVQLRNDFTGVSITGPVSTLEFSSKGILTNQSTDAFLKVTRGAYRDSVFVSPAGRMYRDF